MQCSLSLVGCAGRKTVRLFQRGGFTAIINDDLVETALVRGHNSIFTAYKTHLFCVLFLDSEPSLNARFKGILATE